MTLAGSRLLVPKLLFLSFSFMLFQGCAKKYTRHMSETYKEAKIDSVTFGVVSLPEMEYLPPTSCMSGSGGKGDGAKYQAEWEAKVMKSLTTTFKKHKFKAIQIERLEELGISAPSFQSQAEEDIEKMGVEEYEAQGGTLRPMEYLPARSGGRMRDWGAKLKQNDSVDFIIALVQPKMSGEIHHSYSAPAPGQFGGGGSSTTVYTTNVRYGIWSAETGELAYASGSIAASSGFCFFMSPQTMSIEGNTGDMSTQLKALITAFLKLTPAERLEVGRAMTSVPALDLRTP